MKISIFLAVLVGFLGHQLLSQIPEKCEALLNEKINLSNEQKALETIVYNMEYLKACYLDSLDAAALSYTDYQSQILVEFGLDDAKTYGDWLDRIQEIIDKGFLEEIKIIQRVEAEFLSQNWGIDDMDRIRELGSSIHLEDEYFIRLETFLGAFENDKFSIEEIFAAVPVEQQKTNPPSDIELMEPGNYSPDFIDMDVMEALKLAEQEGKGLLVYFTGHALINGRKMEESVLIKKDISQEIAKHFFILHLNVDDNTELPEEDVVVNSRGKLVSTVGKRNSEYQKSTFQSNIQPFFYFLSSNGQLVTSIGYSKYPKFRETLDCAIRALE